MGRWVVYIRITSNVPSGDIDTHAVLVQGKSHSPSGKPITEPDIKVQTKCAEHKCSVYLFVSNSLC